MTRALVALACLVTIGWTSTASAATWRRLRTDNFLLIGDASESQIKEVAKQLEHFRAVMTLAMRNASPTSPVPTIVTVFSSDRAFQPYQPRFEGRRVEVAGLFVSSEDVNYLAINAEFIQASVRIVLHEYTHSLVGNTLGILPVWLNEGLAEFYETAVESRDGRGAIIGTAPREHLDLLQRSTLIPLDELMSVDRNSPMYNEGSQRGVFYAQAWALTHYLALGSPQRQQQFQNYINLVRQAGASTDTFRAAFGVEPSAMQEDLSLYVRNFSFPAVELTFSDKVTAEVTARAETISEPEAFGYLGDMMARLGRADEARAFLTKTMSADARAVRPVTALGLLELRADHNDEAVALLVKAVALADGDAMATAALGRALIAQANGQALGSTERAQTLERARVVLERATQIDPDTAQTLAVLGYAEMASRRDFVRAATLLERASAVAPARENYRFMLADAYMQARNYDAAARQLGQLAARGSRPDVRQEARDALARVAAARVTTTTATTPSEATRAAAAIAAAQPPPAPGGTASTSSGTAAAPRVVLDLRPAGAGEQEVLGEFQAIECGADRTYLVVQVGGRTMRFGVRSLTQMTFMTFRDDTPANMNCGVFGRSYRAILSYRAGQGPLDGDGQAVAIQLVPDDFTGR